MLAITVKIRLSKVPTTTANSARIFIENLRKCEKPWTKNKGKNGGGVL